MKIFRQLLILLVFLTSSISWADTAICTIEIEDVNAAVKNETQAKYRVEATFSFEAGASALTAMKRKYFNLPDGRYLCHLAFLDLNTGTSLSCEKKEDHGHTYMQSDQSRIKVSEGENNLTFRDGGSHFVLSAKCASKA